jgi:hypothetical protein
VAFDFMPGAGLPDVLFSNQKNPNMDIFRSVLQYKILVYFMAIWFVLPPLEIFYGHLVYFVVIWYTSPRLGILYQ